MTLNPSEFLIRKANLDDVQAIAFINSRSWQTTYKDIIDPLFLSTVTPEQQLPRAKRLVSSETLYCIVAEQSINKQIAGFACFGNSREPKIDADCELQAIYLLQAFQFKGIGKMLFNAGVSDLKKKLKTKMFVSVFKDNNSACRFYEKMGGVQIENDYVSLSGINYETSTYIWQI